MVFLIGASFQDVVQRNLNNFEKNHKHGEYGGSQRHLRVSSVPLLLIRPLLDTLNDGVNKSQRECDPCNGAEYKAPLSISHALRYRRQGADTKDDVQARSPDSTSEGNFSHPVQLGAVSLGIDEELLEVSLIEEHAATNNVHHQEPERQESNMLSNSETDPQPGRLGAQGIPVPHVMEMGQDA